MEILNNLNDYLNLILQSLGSFGPLIGCLLICVESILPFFPLSAFITLNFISYGNVLGFIISWIFTIFGCMLSFTLFRRKFKNWFLKKVQKKKRIEKIMNIVNKLSFTQLVIILAIPFTPAFIVNIAAAFSKISYKKYLFALIIGKISLVYFWGYIGVSLVQSLKHPAIILKVLVFLAIAYLISYIVNRKFKLDGD